jgi:DNA-3-methyladenine glycosylase II
VKKPELAAAVAKLRVADPKLGPVIDRHGPPPLTPTRDPFHSLARAIVYQQLSGAAAGTIFGRFLALYPGGKFPTPDALAATPVARLRSAGLSGAKAAALLDLAAHFADGRVRPAHLRKAGEDEVRAALLPVRGIGPWSVDMFLIFGLVRPDVLPVGDLGVRKGMQLHFRLRTLPEAPRMEKLAAPWRPYRSLAAWYMWRVVEDSLTVPRV